MNSFNKTEALLSHAGYASWGLSLSSVYYYKFIVLHHIFDSQWTEAT